MDATSWHSLNLEQVFQAVDGRPEGLSAPEAADRLLRFGPNELSRRKPASPIRLFLKQFANFFMLVLLFAAALAYGVSYLPGESGRRLTAFFILGIVGLSVLLSFFEEFSAQKELDALDKLLVFKATVIRDGSSRQLDAAEVVPGDVLVLSHGQKIPADARVIEAHSLRVDESALTGESLGADKSAEPVPAEAPLAERASMVYGSTYVTHGAGTAVAVRTGMNTEVGQIAGTLEHMTERPTPFQVEVEKMARQMTTIVGVLAGAVAVILLLLLHEPPVDVALNTLSLAVATIPESLPIVLTFALAMGAHRMAARSAVVRRLAVVESLGSVDTICTDKTGTLTQNVMTVQRLFVDGQVVPVPQSGTAVGTADAVLRAATLCNEAVIEDAAALRIIGDPVDSALLRAAYSAGVTKEIDEWTKVNEIPFSSERKMMTTIHQREGCFTASTKGAAEAVLQHCTTARRDGRVISLDTTERQLIEQAAEELERQAWYVLALAQKVSTLPFVDETVEEDLTFLGLTAMMDPPRPEAADAIRRAQGAGIRVVMITGDNALTAQAIGRQLGIGESVVLSTELDGLSAEALRERMRTVDIVARATPQTKQRILESLQAAGHFTAMTGDGVNDATALKQSDVGVGMGLRGTDIAKESASMILMDDNFATIVTAVEEGRRIFDNIRKFTNYLLSTSLGEVFVVLLLSASGYFPLSAKMLLWVNVVTDLIPASALAGDPAVPEVMQRRPRRHDEPIINKAIYATIAGSIIRTLIAYGLVFWAGLRLGGVEYARTMLFTSIVLHAFTRVLVVRQLDDLSVWSNPALMWSYAAALGLQLLALYTPLRELFGVVPLDPRAWAILIPVVALSSLAGVYMTRLILRWIPLWAD
jgi:Ca2+-transporting ATPase